MARKRPPFENFPALTDGELTLRQVKAKDLPELMEATYLAGRPARDLAHAEEIMRKIESYYQQGECVHWAIAHAKSKQLLGTCGFYRGFDDGVGEVGYVLKEKARGQGIMAKAMRIALRFAFSHMGLKSVIALTPHDNLPSQKLLVKAGFLKEEDRKGLACYRRLASTPL